MFNALLRAGGRWLLAHWGLALGGVIITWLLLAGLFGESPDPLALLARIAHGGFWIALALAVALFFVLFHPSVKAALGEPAAAGARKWLRTAMVATLALMLVWPAGSWVATHLLAWSEYAHGVLYVPPYGESLRVPFQNGNAAHFTGDTSEFVVRIHYTDGTVCAFTHAGACPIQPMLYDDVQNLTAHAIRVSFAY